MGHAFQTVARTGGSHRHSAASAAKKIAGQGSAGHASLTELQLSLVQSVAEYKRPHEGQKQLGQKGVGGLALLLNTQGADPAVVVLVVQEAGGFRAAEGLRRRAAPQRVECGSVLEFVRGTVIQ